jgi:hypothetical protein
MTPTFTILIGSKGRPSLRATLESIVSQALVGDQVYVGFDGLQVDLAQMALWALAEDAPWLKNVVRFYRHVGTNRDDVTKIIPTKWSRTRAPIRIPPGAPYSWLGVEQINYAIRSLPITGSHVFTLGDDDVFVPGAFTHLRAIAAEDPLRPLLYRFVAPWREVLWDRPRLQIAKISGCCIAAPREFVDEHPTAIEPTHDYRWLEAIVAKATAAGHPPRWIDYIGVVARPDASTEKYLVEVPAKMIGEALV